MSAYEITDPAAVDEARPPLAQAQARARFRWRRAARRRSTGSAAAEEARAELVLLREENARLKAAPHQPPSFDRVVAQARALLAGGDAADAADEASELLVEMIVLRESLLAVCEELERSLAGVRAKLDRIGAETRPGAGDDAAG